MNRLGESFPALPSSHLSWQFLFLIRRPISTLQSQVICSRHGWRIRHRYLRQGEFPIPGSITTSLTLNILVFTRRIHGKHTCSLPSSRYSSMSRVRPSCEYSPSSPMLRLTETFSSHSALRTNCLTLPNLLTGLLDDVAESFVGSGRVVLPMSHEDEDEESFHTKRNRNREPYREKMRNDLFGLQMVWWYADRLSLQALCCFWELRLRCADLHWEVSLVAMVARTSEVVI